MQPSNDLTPAEQRALSQMKGIDFRKILDPLFEEFKNQSDRAAVIVGASQIDALLG
jgi:hypothetical protein